MKPKYKVGDLVVYLGGMGQRPPLVTGAVMKIIDVLDARVGVIYITRIVDCYHAGSFYAGDSFIGPYLLGCLDASDISKLEKLNGTLNLV